jgi:hypothetical protein
MSSFEFHYARMTAQSPGCDPNRIQGGRPEFTPAFVAQMAGRIKPRAVYHAAMSLYCEDTVSMDELNTGMANWCWVRILKRRDRGAYKPIEIVRVAELAVLMYLFPWVEESRSPKKCAAWVQIAPQTWMKKYSIQRDIIVYELNQMRANADYQLHVIMRDEPSEMAISAW